MRGRQDQGQRRILDGRPLGREPGDRIGHRFEQVRVRACHRDHAVRTVLRLSGQVERNQLRVSLPVGNHEQLGGPGDAVDADQSHEPALRLLHVRVPGPTITSTGATESVPYASAATAWAPPIRYTTSTPHNLQAARVAALAFPSGPGGVATAISVTPATRAGTQHITTDDGYAARPPGTYTPARPTGRFCSVTV